MKRNFDNFYQYCHFINYPPKMGKLEIIVAYKNIIPTLHVQNLKEI